MLEQYGGYKRELDGLLDRAAALSLVGGRPETERALRELVSRLKENRFVLVVLGEFKRGKSTLINALLGREVVPSGVTPLTTVATEIQYSDETGALVKFLDGREMRVTLDRISEFVTEKENPVNEKGVASVEVFLPSPFLREGVVLVDTPGVGSIYTHNTDTAYDYVPKADAALFLVSVDPPISKAECEFLRDVRKHIGKIFFVQNKIDYLNGRELEETLSFTREVLCRELDVSEVQVFPVSAKTALEAKARRGESLDRSGLSALEDDLGRFLVHEKGQVLLQSVTNKLLSAIQGLEFAFSMELKALTMPYEELSVKEKEFSRLAARMEREREEVSWLLQGELDKIIRGIDADLESFKERASETIASELERYYENACSRVPVRDLPDVLTQFVKDRVLAAFNAFRDGQVVRVEREFQAMASRLGERLNKNVRELREAAARLYDIEVSPPDAAVEFEEESDFYFKLDDLPTVSPFRPGTLYSLLPQSYARTAIKKSMVEKTYHLVDRQCGRIRYDLISRLEKSASRLRALIEHEFNEIESLTRSLFKSTMERRRQGEGAVAPRIAELQRLLSEVRQLASEARTLGSALRVASPDV